MGQETKNCQNCKSQFIIEPDDYIFYERIGIPEPDICLRCRWQHLLSFWVFGKFRKAESGLSGKSIITNLPSDVRFPIYEQSEWVSDEWDSISYGQDYDPSHSFISQFKELQSKVPHPHQLGTKNVKCEWSDDVWNSRDCYLCRSLLDCEYLSYGYRTFRCKNSVDVTYCFDTELSYDCLNCSKCYQVRHAIHTRDSMDSAFLYDCRNVQNCFMCWNLRNKQYCIENIQYSKEEYFDRMKKNDIHSYKSIEELYKVFHSHISKDAVHRQNFNVKVVDSTGNFITECKNCVNCFFFDQSENCRNCFRGIQSRDVIDSVGSAAEKCALTAIDVWSYETVATFYCSHCRYSAYLDSCSECEYCFGCAGLRKKKYCILNKQYSEEEYNILRSKIIEDMKIRGEWGRFFPISFALCGYNLSLANIFFPESKERIKEIGGLWSESEEVHYKGIPGDGLADTIDSVPGDFSKEAIVCSKTGWRFNIAPRELEFYKNYGIPLPHHHPDWRTLNRFKLMVETAFLHPGECFFCKKNIQHCYPKDKNYQKIACVDCYQREIG